jgi:biopolymer transport protein ExbD
MLGFAPFHRGSRMRLFVKPLAWTTRKHRTSSPHLSIDLAGFMSVILALAFFLMFGNLYQRRPHSLPVDIPITQHATMQPGAVQDDSLIVTVTRDGTVYLLNTRILPADLPNAIRDLANGSTEKTIYVNADARAKYGDVKVVLDQIRQSGLQNITFLTNHPAAATP